MDSTYSLSRQFVLDALDEFLVTPFGEVDHPCLLALFRVARTFAHPCSCPHVVEQVINPCPRYIKALNRCESAIFAGHRENALSYLAQANVLSIPCDLEHLW